MLKISVLLVGLTTAVCSALELPSFLKPCSRNDPNLDECALKNGIAAIPFLLPGHPKYKMPVLTPLSITEIRVEDPNKGRTSTGMDIIMRDLKMYGFEHAQLKKAHFDLQNKTCEVQLHFPELRLVFQHEVDGKVLVLPIKGKGDGSVNLTDTAVSYKLDFCLITKEDGLTYMQAGKGSMVRSTKHGRIHLGNLFNGDKLLGETTNNFLNENWDIMDQEIGSTVPDAIGQAIRQIIDSCMTYIPYDYLFPVTV